MQRPQFPEIYNLLEKLTWIQSILDALQWQTSETIPKIQAEIVKIKETIQEKQGKPSFEEDKGGY